MKLAVDKSWQLIKPPSLHLLIKSWNRQPSCFIPDSLSLGGGVTPSVDRWSWQFLGPSPRCWRRTILSDRDSSLSARSSDAALSAIAGHLPVLHLRDIISVQISRYIKFFKHAVLITSVTARHSLMVYFCLFLVFLMFRDCKQLEV